MSENKRNIQTLYLNLQTEEHLNSSKRLCYTQKKIETFGTMCCDLSHLCCHIMNFNHTVDWRCWVWGQSFFKPNWKDSRDKKTFTYQLVMMRFLSKRNSHISAISEPTPEPDPYHPDESACPPRSRVITHNFLNVAEERMDWPTTGKDFDPTEPLAWTTTAKLPQPPGPIIRGELETATKPQMLTQVYSDIAHL